MAPRIPPGRNGSVAGSWAAPRTASVGGSPSGGRESMTSLLVSALRARRLQTVAVFALTVLAAVGGSAAPWFLRWAHDSVAASDIAAAPVSERIVTISGLASFRPGQPSPLTEIRDRAGRSLRIPGSQVAVGGRLFATAVAD